MPGKNDVPLMFRAQVQERCQLQYVKSGDIQQWKEQWVKVTENGDRSTVSNSENEKNYASKEYQFSWRFVTNGGQDDGIIRPAIGAFGLPFYPGSSMKGAFCQACTPEQKQRYGLTKNSDEPSLLRFHGGYPVNDWKQNLVDLVHPQQQWQVKTQNTVKKPEGESAFAMISLYQPKLRFTISSLLPETDWDEVWQIWEKALGFGLGCRVSNGYGWVKDRIDSDSILYRVKLHGEGAASQLFDGTLEFRANIFRSALRGHALRIFGGLNQAIADDAVDELFGGIRNNKETVGLLGITFQLDDPEWLASDAQNAYDVNGELVLVLFGKLMAQPKNREFLYKDEAKHRQLLAKLAEKLTQFAMLLGGFGKSWRRVDHRQFYPKYKKHLIGCHWEWDDEKHKDSVGSLNDATELIKEVLTVAKNWLNLRGFEADSPAVSASSNLPPVSPRAKQNNQVSTSYIPGLLPKPVRPTNQEQAKSTPKLLNTPVRPNSSGLSVSTEKWRERWSKDNVQVWGRIAKDETNSAVVPWLHSSERSHQGNQQNYQVKKPELQSSVKALQRGQKPNPHKPNIYRTSVTGRVKDEKKSNEPTQIGRIWHRMYPVTELVDDPNNPGHKQHKVTKYLELLTFFPDDSEECKNFLQFLGSQPEGFKKLW